MKNKTFKIDYCTCLYHYVCYGGYYCMNRGCGKIHTAFMGKTGFNPMTLFSDLPIKEQKEIINHPEKYMNHYENGEPAWAEKNGSVSEEIYSPKQRAYDERLKNRNWFQKLFNL